MRRQIGSILVMLVLVGCGASVVNKRDETGVPALGHVEAETPVARPSISAGRAEEELVSTIVMLKEREFRQAEAHLEEIVKVRPDLVEAHFNLGWTRLNLGKCKESIVALQDGLKLKPLEVSALNLLAICQRMLGKFAEAERIYQQALVAAPDNAKLHLNIGVLYDLYLFRPELALVHYRRYQALQNEPDARVAGWITLIERKEGK